MAIRRLARNVALCLSGGSLLATCGGYAPGTGGQAKLLATSSASHAVWSSSAVHAGDNTARRNDVNYTAADWTQGGNPSTRNGAAGSGQPWIGSGTRGATPAPAPARPLAMHALVGYWHNFTNPSGNTYPIAQVSDEWDVIVVSFADNAGNGNVGFALDPNAGSESQFIADIKAKQAKGKKVVLSLGGQDGSVSVGSEAEASNFANSLYGIITKYGFDGIDLDLERGVSQGAAIQTFLPIAVKKLKARLGSNFYLSMAPEWVYVEGGYTSYGGIWGAYIPIINALRNELTILHPQYYNNGDIYTPYQSAAIKAGSANQLVATAKMLIEGFTYGGNTFAGLRPDQVAFGVPSGGSSANSGFASSADVRNALTCLTMLTNCGTIRPNAAYPTFRGVMTWSINWDKHDGYDFSVPAKASLRSLP